MSIYIKTHRACDFPVGFRTPYPPSGSALVHWCFSINKKSDYEDIIGLQLNVAQLMIA